MTVATAPERGLIPFSPIWELQLYKLDEFWAFDLPEYGVHEELLCGGTEHVLNAYFLHLSDRYAKRGDTMLVRLYNGDHVTPQRFLTTLRDPTADSTDPDSTYYVDTVTERDVWFCPFLLTLWSTPPTIIYVDFKL
jgi:hypothetical protein